MPKITLRLYCHGLGDCHLLKFEADAGAPFWMLIDCGIHSSTKGGKALVREVVEDIRSCTDRLDVVVGTHEHWDHNSGFIQAQDLFENFEVGEVWLAWTENPADDQAKALDKYKGDALAAVRGAAAALALDEGLLGAAERLGSLLGFVFGATGDISRTARENLRALSPVVRYLEPGQFAPLPAGLDDFRVYVLAPSRNPKLFGMVDSASETYSMGPQWSGLVGGLTNGLAIREGVLSPSSDPLAPFDSAVGIKLSDLLEGEVVYAPDDLDARFFAEHYTGPNPAASATSTAAKLKAAKDDQSWRRIDSDWLGASSELALQLDSRTNNTSLVLAIETVATGKVLLFAADAQVGNWKGWSEAKFKLLAGQEKPVEVADLLARTVFYKVGHHGSRNATRGPGGLEAMSADDLIAFIPTDQVMAKKVGWSDIPARALLEHLGEKTKGRIVMSDSGWIQSGGARPQGTNAAWFGGIEVGLSKVDPKRGLYVELTF